MKPAGKCIFCDGGNLSREHFWSDWAGEELDKLGTPAHVEHMTIQTGKPAVLVRQGKREKQGGTWTKKIRVVCRSCNNGWMSVLETEAQPVLARLMKSEPFLMSTRQQATLAQWIAMKVMVAEHNDRSDWVTLPEDRHRFKLDRTIPPHFQIWIGRCGLDGWGTGYYRQSATVGFTTEVAGKNIQGVTFGFGDLLVHVLSTTVDGLELVFGTNRPGAFQRLHPPRGGLMLMPSRVVLSAADVHRTATSLDRMFAAQNVIWHPGTLPPRSNP